MRVGLLSSNGGITTVGHFKKPLPPSCFCFPSKGGIILRVLHPSRCPVGCSQTSSPRLAVGVVLAWTRQQILVGPRRRSVAPGWAQPAIWRWHTETSFLKDVQHNTGGCLWQVVGVGSGTAVSLDQGVDQNIPLLTQSEPKRVSWMVALPAARLRQRCRSRRWQCCSCLFTRWQQVTGGQGAQFFSLCIA